MPESPPLITLNTEGICNLCQNYKSNIQEQMLESELIKILKKKAGKEKYDCLVMCSGGKDSTAALYYMKERYHLNPLAFTFDHGFETEEALNNIKKAVEILEVDFVYHRSSFMKKAFAKVLETNSKASICHLCSIWNIQLTYQMAQRYRTPLIVAGWTKGQLTNPKCDSSIEFTEMGQETLKFIKEHLHSDADYKDFPTTVAEVEKRSKKMFKTQVISPLWFLPFDQEIYKEMIKNKLEWQQTTNSYPQNSTNCSLNYLSVRNSLKHYGFTHYHVEMSKLIRQGLKTREEALKELEASIDEKDLQLVISKLS